MSLPCSCSLRTDERLYMAKKFHNGVLKGRLLGTMLDP